MEKLRKDIISKFGIKSEQLVKIDKLKRDLYLKQQEIYRLKKRNSIIKTSILKTFRQ